MVFKMVQERAVVATELLSQPTDRAMQDLLLDRRASLINTMKKKKKKNSLETTTKFTK
jgi:hypothetical protein